MKRHQILLVSFLMMLVLMPLSARASVFYLLVKDEKVFNIGDKFEISVKIDSEGVGINAAQGRLEFPQDILQVESLNISQSVFNFWLEEPAFSNELGEVTFVGGSSNGSIGKSLEVLKVNFVVKGGGE